MKRRRFLALSGAGVLASTTGGALGLIGANSVAQAEAPVELNWPDLVPGGGDKKSFSEKKLLGIKEHGSKIDVSNSKLVSTYNGKRVRLPGYMVPLDFQADGVRKFLLVPFIGACIHVPPPPPNQIVLVESKKPYPTTGYFDPVKVTGTLSHLGADLDLAEVGYRIAAETVAAYSE
ncbi:MAG: DUF3299 domain-containing protein [Neomegalonema sp.]|nr:DUF3299 domain-containing protein [Neomegalonema sp.]